MSEAWSSRMLGGTGTSWQHAVDAVADAQVVLQRLDVDVGGALLERLAEDLVDEVHHRGLLVVLVQHGDLLLHVIGTAVAVAAFEQFFKVLRAHAVALVQRFEDAPAGGQPPGDPLAHLVPHRLPGIEIERIVGQQRTSPIR